MASLLLKKSLAYAQQMFKVSGEYIDGDMMTLGSEKKDQI